MSDSVLEDDLDDDEEAPPVQPTTPEMQKRLRLWLAMLRSTRHIENTLRERLKTEFDATLPRFDVLATLFRHDKPMTMSELSRDLVVSNGNVTGIVDRLEDEGMVYRESDERDRRASVVSLTAEGEVDFAYMAVAHRDWINEMLGSLSMEDIDTMSSILQGLRAEQKKTEDAKRRRGKDKP
jgi:DNA-binding MarR family transcriptional regulator